MAYIELACKKWEAAVTRSFAFIERKISKVENGRVGLLFSNATKSQKRYPLNHSILCDCRNCVPSITTFHRSLRSMKDDPLIKDLGLE